MIDLYTINENVYHDNIYQLGKVRKNMEIIVIGMIAGTVASSICPYICPSICPK
jgi:hypothetical protein